MYLMTSSVNGDGGVVYPMVPYVNGGGGGGDIPPPPLESFEVV